MAHDGSSVAMSFSVWCGGGLRKQRTAKPQRRKQRAQQELFLLQNRSAPVICVAVVEVRREGIRGSKGEWHVLLSEGCGFLSLFSIWSLFGEGFK